MGNFNSGRSPLPVSAHKLRGSYRRDRHGERDDTFYIPAAAPDCPEWLSDAAKAEWRRVVPLLVALDLILPADLGVLVGYCQAFADVQAAISGIIEHGYTYAAGERVYPRPEVALLKDASARLHTFSGQLGLSPVARNRVKVGAPSEESGPASVASQLPVRDRHSLSEYKLG